MNEKFTNVYLDKLSTMLQLLKLNWAVFSFAPYSGIFFVSGSLPFLLQSSTWSFKDNLDTISPRLSLFARIGRYEVTSRYDWSRRFIMSFSSQTRVLHVVDLFSVFCGIIVSFLS